MTRQLILELKEAGQDFEFYPTTDEMLAEAYRALESVSGYYKSVLDIGCGTCNFKRYIERKGGKVEYFGIEKSDILIGKLPYDVFVLGTDFNNTTLIDKKVDFIFCNPPYSEYENWTNRIIREGNFKKAVLVIPERWKENPRIQASLKAASVTYIIENSFDFLHAERQARAKVDVVCFEKKIDEFKNKTPFDLWFEETFNINQKAEKNCFEEREEKKEAVKNELVTANNKVEKLVSLYNADLNRLSSSFAAICSIDEKILNDIGVNYTGVKKALKTKIEGLKILYWRLVFDYLDEITERLTHKTRDALFDKFEKLNCVDFNESNIRSVVIWVIKNASDFYNRQLIEFYKSLSENTNVKPYKSNIKTFKKDRWRFYQGDDKYVLDYRIISGSLFESQLGWSGEFDSWNDRRNKFVIDDLCAIARNLGFEVGSKEMANAFNEKFYIYMKNGEPLMEYKIYKNHNTHIKLNVEFAKAMNVEVGRLLGWIRDKSDIAKEFPDDLAKGAEKYFNSSFGLIGTDIKLLSVK